jgi:homoserine O-acetyltransferase
MAIFRYDNVFELETGETLQGFHLEYQTFGSLNKDKSNVVWIFHALTANSNPLDWWQGLVGEHQLITPNEYFIICVNMPGSCYGSIGPLSINAKTGEPYYHQFPLITPRDMANMYDLLRQYLQINQVYLALGGSMGGMQLLEFAIQQPQVFKHVVLVATNAKHSPWGIAFNAAQRMAIEADATWQLKQENAGAEGLKAARAMAMVSYRNYYPFLQTQREADDSKYNTFKAESYLRYQAQKLQQRFNAFSYYALSQSMDAHNVGRNRSSVAEALQFIQAKTLVVGIESDLLFPIEEQIFLSQHINQAEFKLIESPYGHDGFLIEFEQLHQLISSFLNEQ